MERRKAIRNIGLSFGTMVTTPSILGLLQSCQEPEAVWKPEFFSEEQGVFVKNLVNTILPSSGDIPGATDVNVHVFIDRFVKDVMSKNDLSNYLAILNKGLYTLLEIADTKNINEVEEEHYIGLLETHLKKSKEESDEMMEKIEAYSKNSDGRIIGLSVDLSTFLFLTGFRDLAIWSFKRTEEIGKKVMVYRPVPGEQKGCVDLEETTGGRAWSIS